MGKKILFIGIGFYDYENCIKTCLEGLGASLTYRLQQPRWHQVAILRRLASFIKISIEASGRKYQSELLNEIKDSEFDIVFVIKGDMLEEEFILGLRKLNPAATFIQYQWDSVRRVPNALRMATHFDRVYSFDRFDCIAYPNLQFRPLFYRAQRPEDKQRTRAKYQLMFIGWLHADRLTKILEVDRKFKLLGGKAYFFLYTGIRTYLKECFRGNGKNLCIRKISYKDVENLMESAECILDIPHPEQTGLTIRTMETLGSKRKLVTTNEDVRNYDFYNPANILISKDLDAQKIREFIDVPYQKVPDPVMAKYSLQYWISEIFS